ncbi:hypothetical protein CEP51_016765 [Fusarium floridanum]|uniref:Uncharacterized protein n=1 Tax=Fusarium floridanum TaxID=1325733 RepID=A0A428NGF7_9HYPO|nr:hypothetical protein CEP51_016765 [Fusarium floridanum]
MLILWLICNGSGPCCCGYANRHRVGPEEPQNPNAFVVYFPLSFLILKVNSIGIDSWNPITISRSHKVADTQCTLIPQ